MTEKERLQLRLQPETREKIERWQSAAGCRSMNEFVEKAVNFYADYLASDDSGVLLSPAIQSAIDGQLQEFKEQLMCVFWFAKHARALLEHLHGHSLYPERSPHYWLSKNSAKAASVTRYSRPTLKAASSPFWIIFLTCCRVVLRYTATSRTVSTSIMPMDHLPPLDLVFRPSHDRADCAAFEHHI